MGDDAENPKSPGAILVRSKGGAPEVLAAVMRGAVAEQVPVDPLRPVKDRRRDIPAPQEPPIYRVSSQGEDIGDADSIEAVRGIVRTRTPGRYHSDDIRADHLPLGPHQPVFGGE